MDCETWSAANHAVGWSVDFAFKNLFEEFQHWLVCHFQLQINLKMKTQSEELDQAARYALSGFYNYIIKNECTLIILTREARLLNVMFWKDRGFQIKGARQVIAAENVNQIVERDLAQIWDKDLVSIPMAIEIEPLVDFENVIFESLDALLFKASPQYSVLFQNSLYSKLSELGGQDISL